ncbi:hypothetical protein PENANT_c024G07344 [Penicillium antarcticum]|uniref:Uncharacterized protein n=1 Tax=Penicillium antarcticum TaxID=416450 RepID=A0A1V6PYG4_9EURO|nr:hypothetical protein PENANT_c024G07344 [Penicillium antarcticum]
MAVPMTAKEETCSVRDPVMRSLDAIVHPIPLLSDDDLKILTQIRDRDIQDGAIRAGQPLPPKSTDEDNDIGTKGGSCALLRGAQHEQEATTRKSLQAGAHIQRIYEPDDKTMYKSNPTPLSLAAENGHEIVVKLLLATERVDPYYENNPHETAWSVAQRKGHTVVLTASGTRFAYVILHVIKGWRQLDFARLARLDREANPELENG